MTSIDSTAQLAALIRNQMPSLNKAAVRRKLASSSQPGQAERNNNDIAGLVAQRVAIIDAEDPQRERKAFRIFLETVLINELGMSLAEDPAFYTLLEEVQRQMESDPEVAASIQKAAQILLQSKK